MAIDSPPKSPVTRGAVLESATPEEVAKNEDTPVSTKNEDTPVSTTNEDTPVSDQQEFQSRRELAPAGSRGSRKISNVHLTRLSDEAAQKKFDFKMLLRTERREKIEKKLARFLAVEHPDLSASILRQLIHNLMAFKESDLVEMYFDRQLMASRVNQFVFAHTFKDAEEYPPLSPRKQPEQRNNDVHLTAQATQQEQVTEVEPAKKVTILKRGEEYNPVPTSMGEQFDNVQQTIPVVVPPPPSHAPPPKPPSTNPSPDSTIQYAGEDETERQKFELLLRSERREKIRNRIFLAAHEKSMSFEMEHSITENMMMLPENELVDVYFDESLLRARVKDFVYAFKGGRKMPPRDERKQLENMPIGDCKDRIHKKFLHAVNKHGGRFSNPYVLSETANQMMELPLSDLLDMYFNSNLLAKKVLQFIQDNEDRISRQLFPRLEEGSPDELERLEPEHRRDKIRKKFITLVHQKSSSPDMAHKITENMMLLPENELVDAYFDEPLLRMRVDDFVQAYKSGWVMPEKDRRKQFKRMPVEECKEKIHTKFKNFVNKHHERFSDKPFSGKIIDQIMEFPLNDLLDMYFDNDKFINRVQQFIQEHEAQNSHQLFTIPEEGSQDECEEDRLQNEMLRKFKLLEPDAERRRNKFRNRFSMVVQQNSTSVEMEHALMDIMLTLNEESLMELYFDENLLNKTVEHFSKQCEPKESPKQDLAKEPETIHPEEPKDICPKNWKTVADLGHNQLPETNVVDSVQAPKDEKKIPTQDVRQQLELMTSEERTNKMHKKFHYFICLKSQRLNMKKNTYKITEQMMELPESDLLDMYCDDKLLSAKSIEFIKHYEENKKEHKLVVKARFVGLTPTEQNFKMHKKFLHFVMVQSKRFDMQHYAYEIVEHMMDLLPEDKRVDVFCDEKLCATESKIFTQKYHDNKPLHRQVKINRVKAAFENLTPEAQKENMHKKFLGVVIGKNKGKISKNYARKIVDQMMELLPENELLDLYADGELLKKKSVQFTKEYEENKTRVNNKSLKDAFDLLTATERNEKLRNLVFAEVIKSLQSGNSYAGILTDYMMSLPESELRQMHFDDDWTILKDRVDHVVKEFTQGNKSIIKLIHKAHFDLKTDEERQEIIHKKFFYFVRTNSCERFDLQNDITQILKHMIDLIPEDELLDLYLDDELLTAKVTQFDHNYEQNSGLHHEVKMNRVKARFELSSPEDQRFHIHQRVLGTVMKMRKASELEKCDSLILVEHVMDLPESELHKLYFDEELLHAKVEYLVQQYKDGKVPRISKGISKDRFNQLTSEERTSRMHKKFLAAVCATCADLELKRYTSEGLMPYMMSLPDSELEQMYFDRQLLDNKVTELAQALKDGNKDIQEQVFKARFNLMSAKDQKRIMHQRCFAVVAGTSQRLGVDRYFSGMLTDYFMSLAPIEFGYLDDETLATKVAQVVQEFKDEKSLKEEMRKHIELMPVDQRRNKIRSAVSSCVSKEKEFLDVKDSSRQLSRLIVQDMMSLPESDLMDLYFHPKLMTDKVLEAINYCNANKDLYEQKLRDAEAAYKEKQFGNKIEEALPFEKMTPEQRKTKIEGEIFAIVSEECARLGIQCLSCMLTDRIMELSDSELEMMYEHELLNAEYVVHVVQKYQDEEDVDMKDFRASFEELSDQQRNDKLQKVFHFWVAKEAHRLDMTHFAHAMTDEMMLFPESKRIDMFFDHELLHTKVAKVVDAYYKQCFPDELNETLRKKLLLLVTKEVVPMGLQSFANKITRMLLTLPDGVTMGMVIWQPELVKHWVSEAVKVLESGDFFTIKGNAKDISCYVMVQVLDTRFDTHNLFKMFKKYGAIISCNICRDESRGCRINGYGFVQFTNSASAKAAVSGTKDHAKLEVNHFNRNNRTAGTPEGDLALRYPEVAAMIHPRSFVLQHNKSFDQFDATKATTA